MGNIDKYTSLIAKIIAIREYSKDIHYSSKGSDMYDNHKLADEVVISNYMLDELKEICFLGKNMIVPDSIDFLEKAIEYKPVKSEDNNYNFTVLRELVLDTLMFIEEIKSILTFGEANIVGNIAQELQLFYGLLCAKLEFSTPIVFIDEVNNDSFKEEDHPRAKERNCYIQYRV